MQIVVRTVSAFPRQGLWTVLATLKSSSKERAARGIACIQKITVLLDVPLFTYLEANSKQESAKKNKGDITPTMIKTMINQGQKFSEELLKLSLAKIVDRVQKISLARNMGFNHRTAPCSLVIPLEAMLTPILPSTHESSFLKRFQPFPHDCVTIESKLFPMIPCD
jgi:serine/threonine-protein kinase ATR